MTPSATTTQEPKPATQAPPPDMATGDTSGAVPQLVITMAVQVPLNKKVSIRKGDAVRLSGPMEVTNQADGQERRLFGQALQKVELDGKEKAKEAPTIPVLVRGLTRFQYVGRTPEIGDGFELGGEPGKVNAVREKIGGPAPQGQCLRVDTVKRTVEVLM